MLVSLGVVWSACQWTATSEVLRETVLKLQVLGMYRSGGLVVADVSEYHSACNFKVR